MNLLTGIGVVCGIIALCLCMRHRGVLPMGQAGRAVSADTATPPGVWAYAFPSSPLSRPPGQLRRGVYGFPFGG
jgi:hypothetical protein